MEKQLYIYVGVIGNIISVLMFLSPVKTFWRIRKKGSTEEFNSLPYICTLLNSSLWTYYGITKPGSYLVATVNGFGILVEILYISLFLIYAPPTTRAKTAILAGIVDVGVFVGAVSVTQLGMEGDTRIDVIGVLGAGLNILMYASPLSAMRLVVTTKSVEYMPFLLSLFLFLNGGVWTLYAFLVHDWFLGKPYLRPSGVAAWKPMEAAWTRVEPQPRSRGAACRGEFKKGPDSPLAAWKTPRLEALEAFHGLALGKVDPTRVEPRGTTPQAAWR